MAVAVSRNGRSPMAKTRAKAPLSREIARLRPAGVLADAVEQYLQEKFPSQKRPWLAASLLALILELYEREEAFPPRQQIAQALDCSVYGIDAALSVAGARDLLTIEVKLVPGGVEQRESVVKQRYMVPCEELRAIARSVRQQARRQPSSAA